MNRELPFYIRSCFVLLFLVLIVHVLVALKPFIVPVLFAILFAYLIYPVASFLERHKFPRILANLLTIILCLGIFSTALYLLMMQFDVLVSDLPRLRENALRNIDRLNDWLIAVLGVSSISVNEWLKEQVSELFDAGNGFVRNLFTRTTGVVVRIFLIPVFLFFVLYYRDKFRIFILKMIPANAHANAQKILEEISSVTKNYMIGIFIVVCILCVLNSAGLLIIGIRFAILLGVISAFFNFIPYFGTLIGGAIPLLFALLTEDTPSKAFWIVIFFMIIQFTENNILTPNITGGNVSLNPFVTILALILGGMLWGVAGMFLIIPLLAMLKIVFENFDHLNPFAYLLGTTGTEEHSVTFQKIKRFFSWKK